MPIFFTARTQGWQLPAAAGRAGQQESWQRGREYTCHPPTRLPGATGRPTSQHHPPKRDGISKPKWRRRNTARGTARDHAKEGKGRNGFTKGTRMRLAANSDSLAA